MMILPMLLAPLPIQDMPDKLPDPAPVDSSMILYGPSRSLRSATAAIAGVPAAAVKVRIQCSVTPETGTPNACVALAPNEKPVTSRAEFERRAGAPPAGAAAAALQRVLLIRVKPAAPSAAPLAAKQMLFTETVGAGDMVKLGAPAGTLTSSDIEMDERPDGAVLFAYYPAQALRAGIQARIKANCRVMPDRKLFCRDAELINPDAAITPEIAGEFRNATYQVFDAIRLSPLSKAGDPVVGRDVEMRISFVLPS